MSERPKWFPVFRPWPMQGASDKGYYRTGLRARLDALESLIEGQTGHMVDRAKNKIEEIGKELEG